MYKVVKRDSKKSVLVLLLIRQDTAQVPTMDISHSTVDVTLSDFYAADYVDRLDELKTNIDERQVLSQSAAAALGRKTDQLSLMF